MATAMPTITDNQRVESVFIKHRDKDEVLEPYEVCIAVGCIVGNAALDGVQNITGIWRIYVKSLADRAKLLVKREITIQRRCASYMIKILSFWAVIMMNVSA